MGGDWKRRRAIVVHFAFGSVSDWYFLWLKERGGAIIGASLSEPHTSGTMLRNPPVYIYIYIPYIAPQPHAMAKRNRLDDVIQ